MRLAPRDAGLVCAPIKPRHEETLLLQMLCLAYALVAVARDGPVGGIIIAIASNRWASGPGGEPRSRRACR